MAALIDFKCSECGGRSHYKEGTPQPERCMDCVKRPQRDADRKERMMAANEGTPWEGECPRCGYELCLIINMSSPGLKAGLYCVCTRLVNIG